MTSELLTGTRDVSILRRLNVLVVPGTLSILLHAVDTGDQTHHAACCLTIDELKAGVARVVDDVSILVRRRGPT